jgi:hypothetical protein
MELLDETGQDKSSLIRQLIHWRGGHPASFLATLPPGSAERVQRRERLDALLRGCPAQWWEHRPHRGD